MEMVMWQTYQQQHKYHLPNPTTPTHYYYYTWDLNSECAKLIFKIIIEACICKSKIPMNSNEPRSKNPHWIVILTPIILHQDCFIGIYALEPLNLHLQTTSPTQCAWYLAPWRPNLKSSKISKIHLTIIIKRQVKGTKDPWARMVAIIDVEKWIER